MLYSSTRFVYNCCMNESAQTRARSLAPLFLSLLLAAGADPSLAGEPTGKAEYVETTGSSTIYLTSWESPQANGYLLHSHGSDGEVHDLFVDRELRTVWWRFRAPARKIDVRAVRRGNQIEITGRLDAKSVDRTLQIDGAPWYQSIERSLVPFALGPRGMTEEFWVVQPYSLKARKIEATNTGRHVIALDGGRTDTAVVKISLPGILSMFWSSHYWYRISDGKFVRFEGLRGPPGSPLTTVRLLREGP